MVKHLANEGILSVDGFDYASVSSSPLWLFLLTFFYKLLNPNLFIWISFILNVVSQIITIITIYKIIEKYTNQNLHYLYIILIILMTPFIALSLGGLEHSFQIMFITLFIYNFIGYIRDTNSKSYKTNMLLLAPLIVAIRYEDIAFIASFALLITLILKDLKFAIMLFFSSLTLIAIFGIWSEAVFHLGYLPTSISAKSMEKISLIDKLLSNINYSHIIIVIFFNTLILFKTRKRDKELYILTMALLLTFFIHLTFAKVGWLYRYEAYLVLFSLLNIAIYISRYKIEKKRFILLAMLLIVANYKQIIFSPIKAILSSKAVYEQQIQEGNFVKEFKNYYIATDNIGTIPFMSNNKLLDIHGLSNPKIIELKNSHRYNDKSKKEMIINENVDLIIAYKIRFKSEIIKNYQKLATWKIKNKRLNGDTKIIFYVRDDKVREVKEKLIKFSKTKLPKEVEVIWEKQ